MPQPSSFGQPSSVTRSGSKVAHRGAIAPLLAVAVASLTSLSLASPAQAQTQDPAATPETPTSCVTAIIALLPKTTPEAAKSACDCAIRNVAQTVSPEKAAATISQIFGAEGSASPEEIVKASEAMAPCFSDLMQ